MYEPIKVNKVDSLMGGICTKPNCRGELLNLTKRLTKLGALHNYLCMTCQSKLQLYTFEEKARLAELESTSRTQILEYTDKQ